MKSAPVILLIGRTGQLGWELQPLLAAMGTLVAPSRAELDLAAPGTIRAAVLAARPDIVVNAAGLTAVDEAERDPQYAMAVNGLAPGIIAESAREIGAFLVHYSTSFVFDGAAATPYLESGATRPINAYGASKLAGERAVEASGGRYAILRCGWTYSTRRRNFPLAILKLARSCAAVDVVDDQIGAPTWARDYAQATVALLRQRGFTDQRARYHCSAAGQCSRYEWAQQIVALARAASMRATWGEIRRTKTALYPTPAQRPLYTVLSNERLASRYGVELGPWDARLRAFMAELPRAALDDASLFERQTESE
jgi:dTDP-4-dehydrorhamnose reductase